MKIVCSMCVKRKFEKDITLIEMDGKLHFKCEDCYERWIGKLKEIIQKKKLR